MSECAGKLTAYLCRTAEEKMPKATVIIDISLQNDGKFSCFWIVGCATSYHAWLNRYILYWMLAAV